MKKYFITLFVFVFIVMIVGEQLLGMPAFARKYRMSCKTCHNPFPRLKAYGDEFAGNGFVLKDQDAPRYFVDTGDKDLSLIRDFPIALRLEGHIMYNNGNAGKVDFASPYLLKLLSGGIIAKNISYYFYFFLGERGEVAGLEDAFIMFNDVFGTGISVFVGQFQVSDPLFKRELRLTFEDYQIYRTKVGNSGINLTYDRGIMLNWGFAGGTDFTVEILNGSGIDEADILKNFDTDKYKNVFGRISQGLGELLRVGVLGYYGKEAPDQVINEIWMWGADATLSFGDNMELNLQFVERRDKNPYFRTAFPVEIKTRGAFGELIWTPGGDSGNWYAAALLNWVDSEQDILDYQSASLHAGLLLRRNFRLVGEVTYFLKSAYGDDDGEHLRAGIGLITAF